MPETSTTRRAWRTDPVDEVAVVPAPGVGVRSSVAGCSGWAPLREGMALIGRWYMTMAWAGRMAWWRCLGRPPARFEEALHEFTTELAASTHPGSIEAALIRLSRRIAPSGGVELIRAVADPLVGGGGLLAAAADDGAGRPGPDGMDFRLRWGAADHGVLRLHLFGAKARPELRRRLAMACTLAAGALDGMRLRAMWSCNSAETDGGTPGWGATGPARTPQPRRDRLRDATFLNAVLPFALEQSRRHGEPVSLICARIDRLGAIRDLLGTATADRLVGELGELVVSLVRASDVVARLDDDRIVALLVRSRGEGAMKVARSIGRAVADAELGSPGLPGVSVAIGAAEFPMCAGDAASLLEAADQAMAMARADGSRSPFLAGPRPVFLPGDLDARPAATEELSPCGP